MSRSGHLQIARGENPTLGRASVLYAGGAPDLGAAHEPSCFRDLNLDQVVEAVVSGREEYDLVPFLLTPLTSVEEIGSRHEVFRDLVLGHRGRFLRDHLLGSTADRISEQALCPVMIVR